MEEKGRQSGRKARGGVRPTSKLAMDEFLIK